MRLAQVIGHATATVKHSTLEGWKLLVVRFLDSENKPQGDPLLAVGAMGSGVGDRVMLASDGKWVSELIGSKTTPVRWAVLGIADEGQPMAAEER